MTDIRFPAELTRLRDLLGSEDAVLTLIEQRGGTRLAIPKYFEPGCGLAQVLGERGARTLIAEAGGTDARWLYVPLCKWWRARVYRARGMKIREIALRLGCSDVAVGSYLNGRAQPSDQFTLPLAP